MRTRETIYFDYLRVLSISAVLLLHTSSPPTYLFGTIEHSDWRIAIFYDSLVRWCVPIFFMISGALLLNNKKEESILEFTKKRTSKILIPFIVWSIVYYIWFRQKFNIPMSIPDFFIKFFNNEVSYHLWYIYALIGLYLITPIFRIFIKNSTSKIQFYLLILWIIFVPLVKCINYFTIFNISIYFPIGDYLGYFLLGYYLATYNFSKLVTYIIYLLGLLSVVITFLGTYKLTLQSNSLVEYFFDYTSPNVFLTSIAIFIFVKNFNKNLPTENKIIGTISSTSFGVYLIHPIILNELYPLYLDNNAIVANPVIWIPIIFILTLIISVITIKVIQSLPYIKKIV